MIVETYPVDRARRAVDGLMLMRAELRHLQSEPGVSELVRDVLRCSDEVLLLLQAIEQRLKGESPRASR